MTQRQIDEMRCARDMEKDPDICEWIIAAHRRKSSNITDPPDGNSNDARSKLGCKMDNTL